MRLDKREKGKLQYPTDRVSVTKKKGSFRFIKAEVLITISFQFDNIENRY